jgi:hypothetical protein
MEAGEQSQPQPWQQRQLHLWKKNGYHLQLLPAPKPRVSGVLNVHDHHDRVRWGAWLTCINFDYMIW